MNEFVETLLDLDDAIVLQHLEVPAQVTVGQPAELLQIAERQTLGIGDQRRQYAEPRLLVDDTIEPLVGEAAVRGFVLI